jgi:serine phosphatase RsbU (regulator of sigma subunit)
MAELSIQSADGSKERFPLVKERVTIGRSRESDVFLPDQWLSRHHAEIRRQGDVYFLQDLGSKNGTLLNGTRIRQQSRLKPGDVITLGEHTLTFSWPALEEEDDDPGEPLGTQILPAREISDIITKPALDPEALLRQNRLLKVLSEAAQHLLAHMPLSELFDKVLDLLFEAVRAERGAILLLEGTPRQPVIKASRAREGKQITKISRSIARKVLQERVSLLLPNVLDDLSLRTQDSVLAAGIRSAVCAPLWFTSSDGGPDEVIGLVYLDTSDRSHAFRDDDLRVLTALSNVAAAKIENVRLLEESLEKRRLEEDMRVAAQIQNSLLPGIAPQVPGYGLVGLNHPCRTVGGDYYDFALEQGRLLMALGDVSGKGTGAALLMTVLRASVRGHWDAAVLSEAVARINRTVCQNVPPGRYMTFFLARLDPAAGQVSYVNAGHNPPLLVRADGRVDTLEEGGMVLGIFDSVPYADGQAELRRGDTLLVFSDGVTETFDPAGAEFGEQRLAQLAVRGRGLEAAALQDEILRELDRFAAGTKATDDRTLIVLKRF